MFLVGTANPVLFWPGKKKPWKAALNWYIGSDSYAGGLATVVVILDATHALFINLLPSKSLNGTAMKSLAFGGASINSWATVAHDDGRALFRASRTRPGTYPTAGSCKIDIKGISLQ